MTRGEKNNNYLNIRKSADIFIGEIIPSKDSASKQFIAAEYGYRAAFKILATYHNKGKDTIEKIVTTWAPPSENDTPAYIANVSQRSGINKMKKLNINDKESYVKIAQAMSISEIGKTADKSLIAYGWDLKGNTEMFKSMAGGDLFKVLIENKALALALAAMLIILINL